MNWCAVAQDLHKHWEEYSEIYNQLDPAKQEVGACILYHSHYHSSLPGLVMLLVIVVYAGHSQQQWVAGDGEAHT